MNNPNLSIVAPGGCNANCSFCFWKQEKVIDDYCEKLEVALKSIPPEFRQISITGGEPTLSPYICSILTMIDNLQRFDKVVLTTNGTALNSLLADLPNPNCINHINISRHHFDAARNAYIFNSNSIIKNSELRNSIWFANSFGIDVTLNCVLNHYLELKEEILEYIDFAKLCGASAVCFRKPHGTLEPSSQEKLFDDYEIIGEGSCPVCRTKVQKIDGMDVYWKASTLEPSKDLGEVYEAIIQQDCRVTLDWEGKIEMNNTEKTALSRIGDALISIGNELKSLANQSEKVPNTLCAPDVSIDQKQPKAVKKVTKKETSLVVDEEDFNFEVAKVTKTVKKSTPQPQTGCHVSVGSCGVSRGC